MNFLDYIGDSNLSLNGFKKINVNDKGLSLMLQNIRSATRNFDNLLVSLKDSGVVFDILCLVETWYEKGNLPQVDGYCLFQATSGLNKSSGVAILVDKPLNPIKWEPDIDSIYSKMFDYCFVSCNLNENLGRRCILGTIYRSPNTSIDLFLDFWETLLNILAACACDVILTGDLNLNLLKDVDVHVINFLDINSNAGFRILNKAPTRISGHSSTQLDLFLTNIMVNTWSYGIDSDLTDHNMVVLVIDLVMAKNKHSFPLKHSSFSYINYRKVVEELCSKDFLPALNFTNLNDSFLYIINTFKSVIERYTSAKGRWDNYNYPKKDWITSGILKSFKKKKRLKNRLNKDKDNSFLREKYNRYRNTLYMTVKTAKRLFYDTEFSKVSRDSKRSWRMVNDLINKDSKKIIDPVRIKNKSTNSLLVDGKEISDYINVEYTNSGCNNNFDLDCLQNISYNTDSAFFWPFSEEEVLNTIKGLKNSSAVSIDKISSRLLKNVLNVVPVLTTLGNRMLTEGCFPDCLKVGIVNWRYKGGDSDDMGSFRPITFLSPLGKIFEKMICTRMVSFIEKCSLWNDRQFGFRKNRSTEDALLVFLDNAYNGIEAGDFVLAASLDIAKAFDNVSHKLLVLKINRMGFRGVCNTFLKSYLTDRYVITKIGDCLSEPAVLKKGVPQGSVLGPLLFNLFVNDINLGDAVADMIMFADDNLVFSKAKDVYKVVEYLNYGLKVLYDWYTMNGLNLNSRKSVAILIGSTWRLRRVNKVLLKVYIGTCEVNLKNEIKYLGILIDENLNWNAHIRHVISSCNFFVSVFYRLRNILNKSTLMNIFNLMYLPKIRYGLNCYGATHKCRLVALNRNIKKCIRVINFMGYCESTSIIRKLENIDDIYEMHIQGLVKYFMSLNYMDKNNYMNIEFCRYRSMGTLCLRESQSMLVCDPYCRTTLGKFNLRNRLSYLINFCYLNGVNVLDATHEQINELKRRVHSLIICNNCQEIKNVYNFR